MAEPPAADEVPRAGRRSTRWPALIWALPLGAFIIVLYLVIQWVAERGEVVTVTFARAGGARAGETKVLYQGAEAGYLMAITANADGRRMDFKLRLRPEAKVGLNTNARFYLIGASPTLDLSSLRAVVSGVAIGFAPGEGGTPEDHFEGLDRAPTILPGDRGTRYWLTAHTLGSIRDGAVVLFRGQPIGNVSDVQFPGEDSFRLQVFVFQPFDRLIRPGDRFWKISPVRLAFSDGGVLANLAPLNAILSGGVELDTATADPGGRQSPAGSEFTLYESHNAALQGLSGPTVRYTLAFAGAAGDLDPGAAVTLLGFQIGEVDSARLAYDERTGKPFTAVTALIYPRQLDPAGFVETSGTDWRTATDAKLRSLVGLGYRARLDQSPPIIGARSIALVQISSAATADLSHLGTDRRIPTAPDPADLAGIAAQAGQILAKVNRVPIEAIGHDLADLSHRLRLLIASPQVQDSLVHLDSSLTQIDKMLGQVEPQLGPLVANLNDAAGEISAIAAAAHQLLGDAGGAQDENLPDAIRQLTEAARSVRTLADYLERHPEALIRGKSPER
jgi:paraquat-inducible protein B